jgi:hypothetical protein
MAQYQKRYRQLPLKIPRGPCTELVGKYKKLCLDVIPSPVKERPANQ